MKMGILWQRVFDGMQNDCIVRKGSFSPYSGDRREAHGGRLQSRCPGYQAACDACVAGMGKGDKLHAVKKTGELPAQPGTGLLFGNFITRNL